jgi:hypothetical protein
MMQRLVPALLLVLMWAAPLNAQTLRDNVEDLFRFGDCGEPLCLPVDPLFHGLHFIPALQTGGANVLSFLTNSVGATVTNIPISAATSGAVWGKSETGLPVRTATSAGPVFAERVQTLGKGHFLVGANFTNFNFTSVRGVPLSDLEFGFAHVDEGTAAFENDVLEVRTDLDVTLSAVTAVLTYGVLDRLDFGVAIPFVRTSLSGTSQALIVPFDPAILHRFGTDANPSLTASSSTDGSASGIGDIAARLKAHVAQGERVGFAILGEVRLPTGKEEDLLGSGEVAVRGLGIVSGRFGDFTPHANFGYLHRSGDFQTGAVLATLGFDHLIGGGTTFAADIISELQTGDSKLVQPPPVVLDIPVGTGTSARRILPSNIPERKDHVVLGSFGFKFTTSAGVTLVTNALVPIRRGYLQPDVAWTAGVEYSF